MRYVCFAFWSLLRRSETHSRRNRTKTNIFSRLRANLKQAVPACKPYTITWQPTTPNTVSVLLLKGPSSNVVKFGPSLAEGITNSGSLAWTPSADLEATQGQGYGIQIIDDVTGQYQYSTQFGITKDGSCVSVSSSAVVSPSASKDGYPASTPVHESSAKPSASGYPTKSVESKPVYSTGSAPAHYSTGAPAHNSTVIQPTGSMTVPSTLRPSVSGTATTSRLPEATTNAGSAVKAGLSLAGVAAAFAFIL